MRNLLWALGALAVVAGGPAAAADVEFKPIDTKKLVDQPSKTAPALSAATIDMVGKTAAGSIEKNGYVKTINNLFGFKKSIPTPTQAGPSPLPTPTMFKSTQYSNAIRPVMPTSMPARR
jgi:hypothetical protein